MDREVLIEVGVEELPAAWLPGLNRQVEARVRARLAELRLPAAAPVEVFSTPRRLTARVASIAERQEDLEETITGPPVSAAVGKNGQPSPAAVGFAKKQGVTFEQLTRVQTPKGEYLAYQRHQRGRSAVDVLPALLGGLLRDLAFPKQMHWDALLDDGRGELLFGRPIRWLLFLYGGQVVPFTIGRAANAAGSQVADVEAGAVTYGHRVLASSGRAGLAIEVRSFDEYQATLAEHFVVLDHAERRDRISRDLDLHARRLGGRVRLEDHTALIEEVADLVEFPAIVAGVYPAEFLELPAAVLTTTLVHHQHYFPVLDDAGNLKPAFLAVVNTEPRDERVIAKNAERVVTARLRDAKFFWNADRKVPLESRLERLHTLGFHKKLGSYRDKAHRIERLARWITSDVFHESEAAVDQAGTAARLAKADLTTDMVFEFPELQGTMGGIYAHEEGHPEPVWKAISHHYLPVAVERGAAPSRAQLGAGAVTWAAVSLADKLDTVVGLFHAGERPTGSRDPFGLRRAAHGVLRILIDLPELTGITASPSLAHLLERAAGEARSQAGGGQAWNTADIVARSSFWVERLAFVLEQRGADPRHVAAALWAGEDPLQVSPLEARLKLADLPEVAASADFQQLARAFKRVRNIARDYDAEELGFGLSHGPTFESILTEPAEVSLLREISEREVVIESALARRDYRQAFSEAGQFGPSVAAFFTEIFVMVERPDLRNARLALMKRLERLILSIADISEIVSQTE